MHILICPRCGHDHDGGWEAPQGACWAGATWEPGPIRRMSSKGCHCVVPYATALLYQAQEANTRALYVLAATFGLHQAVQVYTGAIVGKAATLRRLVEEPDYGV